MNQLEQLGGLAGVLLALGWFLKTQTPLSNRLIPAILVAAGTAIYCAYSGWTVQNAVYGFMTSLATIGAHGGTKNTLETDKVRAAKAAAVKQLSSKTPEETQKTP